MPTDLPTETAERYEARAEAAPVVALVPLVFVGLAFVSRTEGWEFLGLEWWQWLGLPILALVSAGAGRILGGVTRASLDRVVRATPPPWDTPRAFS